jgi:hypothetical protein
MYENYLVLHFWHVIVYILHTRPLLVKDRYSRLCPTSCSKSHFGRFDTWTLVHVTTAKFKPLIFSMTGFALSNVTNIFIFYFEFLLLVVCIISLCSRRHVGFGKPNANRGPMCTLKIFHWCRESCFAGAVILVGGFCHKSPGETGIRRYMLNESLKESQLSVQSFAFEKEI